MTTSVPPSLQPSELSTKGIAVNRVVHLLRRWHYLESACLRAGVMGFLRTPAYEVKIREAYAVWSHAERVNDLGLRLAEMRGGHHGANLDPALRSVSDALCGDVDERAFFAGWQAVVGQLVASYRTFVEGADPSANAQDLRVVRRCLADAERDLAWLDEQVEQVGLPESPPAAVRLLQAAGGVEGDTPAPADGAAPVPPAVRPSTVVFDDRIASGDFENYDARMDLPFEERRLAECRIYFNEFYAAGLLATILLDAWDAETPWAFRFDMCHHFFDEVRHAQFGMIRLKELGVEPDRVNLKLMEHAAKMPFLHRLCYLTLGLEVYFMPRKRPRVKRYEEAGDARTQLFADVDWSDEGNHVRYGKTWVKHFLEDDARSIEELQDEIQQHMAKLDLGLPEGQLAPY